MCTKKEGNKSFIKRRNAVLEKRSVEALTEFMETDPEYDNNPIRINYRYASDLAKEHMLLRLIAWSSGVSSETKEWAEKRYLEMTGR